MNHIDEAILYTRDCSRARRAGRSTGFLAVLSLVVAAALLVPNQAIAASSAAGRKDPQLPLKVTARGPSRVRPARRGRAFPALQQVEKFDHTVTGWGPTAAPEAFSTPAIGDISGDGSQAIVVGSNDGSVTAWGADGSFRWSRPTGGAVLSSPVLADLTGSGHADVVVATMAGSVVWIDGRTGAIVRTFSDTPSQACQGPFDYCKPRGFFATPAVADLDGDGHPEIIATSWDHQLYAWHLDGTTMFRKFVNDTIWSSPTVVDLRGDGHKEIVFGGDSGNPDGGWLWMFEGNGNLTWGFPKFLPGQVIWSSVAVADLDGNHRPSLVVGTGLNYPAPAGELLYAFDAAGNPRPGWPVSIPGLGRVVASPAIGDVNGDGRPDVVAATEDGWIVAVSGDGTKLWQTCNRFVASSCSESTHVHGQAVIADVNNDGQLDVVSAMEGSVRVLNGRDGTIESEGLMGTGFPPAGSASVASVGGQTWIVQSMLLDSTGSGHPQAGDVLRTFAFSTGTPLGAAPWPTFRHDFARTGYDLTNPATWYPFRSAEALVEQQYHDLLGRSPDVGGTAYWTGRLTSGQLTAAQVIASFLGSNEFGATLAPVIRVHLGLTNLPPADFTTVIGQLNQRHNGVSTASIADAMIAADPKLSSKSPGTFINDAYRFTWGAGPNAAQMQAGLAALSHGTSRGTVLVGITDHPWAQAVLTPNVNVIMIYIGMLRRTPDYGGYAYWTNAVRDGRSLDGLIAGFQYSPEYAARFH